MLQIHKLYKEFAEAMANLIEHPDCETVIVNDLLDLTSEWGNRWRRTTTREDDARQIRREVPNLLKQAGVSIWGSKTEEL